MFTQKKNPDPTALARQTRRLKRLKQQGISRSTVLVHEDCRPLFEQLKPHLADPDSSKKLTELVNGMHATAQVVNVAQVQQLSPFRYPGGKTWLVPEIRCWVLGMKSKPETFVEPFAGGAMAGLTVANEKLSHGVVLSEIDDDVASVWATIFDGSETDVEWLVDQILRFTVTLPAVQNILASSYSQTREKAFRTIIKNRMQRGGIMASGAGLVKTGEAGRGLSSRWYPETLVSRVRVLRSLRTRITFLQADAFQTIDQFKDSSTAVFFVDPPYTAGGKRAGSRLYTHSDVDHEQLFMMMASVRGQVLMTYDDSAEVRDLAAKYKFRVTTTPMKNTHHNIMRELIITRP
jgi:DNA adenine methylase